MSEHQFDMEDAERYQRLFVAPMVEAVEKKLEAMLSPVIQASGQLRTDVDAATGRIVKLESTNKKALVGWGVFATGVAAAMSYGWNFIKSHFHFS